MVVLGGWAFLMSEVPLYSKSRTRSAPGSYMGYLAHKKAPPP